MKYKLLITALLVSVSATAQEYQSISSLEASNTDFGSVDLNRYYLNSTYYFDKKSSIGPVDQFSYINTTNNLSASYSQSETFSVDDNKYTSFNGEVYINKLLIGGRYSDFNAADFSSNSYSMSLGYLFNENFLLSSTVHKTEEIAATYTFLAKYNHQINQTDYFGLSATTDDEVDSKGISATYFTALADNKYLKVTAEYNDDELNGDHWRAKGEYYLNDYTSAFLQYQKNDYQEIGAKHFFNDHIALSASYLSHDNDNDIEVFNLTLHLQL